MNTFSNTVVIFGGADNEEQAAREVARSFGAVLATATADGKKVVAFTAYKADGFVVDEGDLSGVTQVVIFECSPAAAGDLEVVARCDHHNPGDFGYELGADQYWEASSLGQLCNFWGAERTHELELVAAGDHCPVDAYLGRCENIAPDEFLEFRIDCQAAFYASQANLPNKSAFEIRADMESAKQKLQEAKLVDGVRDLREASKIEGLPEAAMSLGIAYMAALPDTDRDRKLTGNIKIVLGGHTTPEAVKKFMEWGNSLTDRVGDAYGNPTRGFAGVVVKG